MPKRIAPAIQSDSRGRCAVEGRPGPLADRCTLSERLHAAPGNAALSSPEANLGSTPFARTVELRY